MGTRPATSEALAITTNFSMRERMREGLFILCGILLLFLFAGCETTSTGGATIQDYPVVREKTYRLEAPDELEISVLPQAELDREVTIRPDGKISLPLIGDAYVEGKTPMEAADELKALFSKYVKNPSVSVIVTGFHSKRIYVIGEVGVEGAYPYTGQMSVFEAVQEAGSFTRRASLGRVILVRGDLENPQVIDINLQDVVRRGIKSKDLQLQPDDIVFVPPNAFAKAGYTVEMILFPFSPALDLGQDIGSARDLGATF